MKRCGSHLESRAVWVDRRFPEKDGDRSLTTLLNCKEERCDARRSPAYVDRRAWVAKEQHDHRGVPYSGEIMAPFSSTNADLAFVPGMLELVGNLGYKL